MKLILGLGNPGKDYIDSRHNIGFSVIRALAKNYKISFKKEKGIPALSGKGRIEDRGVLLAIPLTFMNLSGLAAAGLLKKYKISLDNLLVVCDDMDLELGRLKIRPEGSSGGHRGLDSIIEKLKKTEFPRLRVGIGRPPQGIDASDYVLTGFARKEKGALENGIKKACACCGVWVKQNIIKSMGIFNQRSKYEKI